MVQRREFIAPVNEELIGGRLRDLRIRRGMKQVEIAEKLGLNQPLVSQYERGEVRIHGALVAAFAKALRASADEILGIEKLKTNGMIGDRRLLRLLQEIEGLPRREKQALIKTIRNYLKGSRVR